MFIYIFTFCISILFLWFSTKCSGILRQLLLFFSIFLPIALAGCRDINVGTDTGGYPYYVFRECYYNDSLKNILTDSVVEPLYVIMMWCACKIFPDFHFCLFITHLVMLVPIIYALIRFKHNVLLSLPFFFLCFYYQTYNAVRQWLALSFCLLSLAELTNGKYLNSLVALVVAYFFHKSSIIFLSVLLIMYAIENYTILLRRKTFIVMVLLIIAMMFSFKEIITNLSEIELVKTEYVERYTDSDMYGSSLPVSLLSINAFNLFVFILLKDNIKNAKQVAFCSYMLTLSLLSCFLGAFSVFAVRIGLYFMVVSILYCMPYILKNAQIHIKNMVVFFYIFYWYMVVVYSNLGETYPYKSALLNL